jgi:hypothetical protein
MNTAETAPAPARQGIFRLLNPVHQAYLNDHAITDEVIRDALIFSTARPGLPPVPDPAGQWIQFPWSDDGEITVQARMWPEPPEGISGSKYLWNNGTAGRSAHFWAIRPVKDDGGPVLITEGTKQSLAVASWAPAEYAVYGMSGCDAWRNLKLARLHRFAGRKVVILLDADAASNLRVYNGGEDLARELRLEDAAEVLFVPSPSWGKGGIDDYLAGIGGPRRTGRLARLISSATAKPAERKPKAKAADAEPEPPGGDLPLLVVNEDRRKVIHTAVAAMRDRWAGSCLFSYGGVMTRLRGHKTEPLDKDAFANWLAETVALYKYRAPTLSSAGSWEPSWPDPVTMGAILSRGGDPEQFPELARVSQTPFIRPDGSVCAKNGYDAVTGTMLVMGNSGMDRLDVPDEPGQGDAERAASFLLDTWLGPQGDLRGIPWRDEASRANTLALLLTPFIRGIVPLVPLAVISGLQMGVGKNLLIDIISRVVTGSDVTPLPWLPDDDEENAKKILSAFREGAPMMIFDEAHVVGGSSLTRAITATTYSDRILGVSKMAAYPNNVTWVSLGNQVSVLADMARRAYWIELYPADPDPQDRPEEAFAHPHIRDWTTDSRPELVTAALVMLRAWYAAGQPAYPRGSAMGSFEKWDKLMSGVLGYAGVPGFLGNLKDRRAERDTTGGFWTDHLAWLRTQFGARDFTTLDVKNKATESGGNWDAPPKLDEPMREGWTRNLGLAYSQNKDRWYGPLRLIKIGTGHGTRGVWRVQSREEDQGAHLLHPLHPTGNTPPDGDNNPPENSDTLPDQGGMKGMKQDAGPAATDAVPGTGGVPSGQYLPELGFPEAESASFPAHPHSPGRDEGDEADEVLTPRVCAPARARARDARTRESGWGPSSAASASSRPAVPFLGFDIESADAGDIFRWPRGGRGEDGVGYVRLAGVIGPGGNRVLMKPEHLPAILGQAGRVDGHNILGFDGPALAWHHGLDIADLAERAFDTELAFRQAKPPRSREKGSSSDRYGLDVAAAELGLPGKTGDLARLRRKFGGYDKIPPDDEEYRAYLMGDLAATAGVATGLLAWNSDPYVRREHRVAALGAQMTLNGFAVDQPLLEQRHAGEQRKKHEALRQLHEQFGLPLSKTVLKGRGKDRHEEAEPLESPMASKPGKAWLEQVFASVPDPPRTPKSGDIATGADELAKVAARPGCPDPVREMIELMAVATGARTVYQTAVKWLCPDGRVHPKNSFRQASGRWSVTDPGMTVFGKHAGRHIERDVFTADEPGWVTVSFDLAQVDMRAIAGHSGDPEYIKLFLPGRDAHTEIALRVFGTARRRQDAKARGHGWNYGMGPERMVKDGIDPAMAYGFDHGMKESFPVMCSWREQVRFLGKTGQILDNGFGRRMRCDPRWAYTVAPALMGQGGARDIMCESLLRLPRWTWPYLRAMVHDEIVCCIPLDLLREFVAAVTQAMTWTWHGPGGSVPILCDINGPGWSWGDINAKCAGCAAAHGPGWCELHAELKRVAAKHPLELAA